MIPVPEELIDDVIEYFAKTPMPWLQSNPFLQRFGQIRDEYRKHKTDHKENNSRAHRIPDDV